MDETIVHETATVDEPNVAPVGEAVAGAAAAVDTKTQQATSAVKAATSAALLNSEVSEHLRTRWNQIQGTFVDEPRAAVQQADALVSEAVEQITQTLAGERSTLESQWKQNNDVSTEDLRKALQHYRALLNRLVS